MSTCGLNTSLVSPSLDFDTVLSTTHFPTSSHSAHRNNKTKTTNTTPNQQQPTTPNNIPQHNLKQPQTTANNHHNHHNHHTHNHSHHHHKVSQLKCGLFFFFASPRTKTPACNMSGRLRSMLRQVATLHHSRDVGPAQHVGLRAQKTANSAGVRPGVLEDPGPRSETEHEQHAALRGPMPPSPGVPSLATPLLAGQAAEGIDPSTSSAEEREARRLRQTIWKEFLELCDLGSHRSSLQTRSSRISSSPAGICASSAGTRRGERGRRRNFLEVAPDSRVLMPRSLVFTARHRHARQALVAILFSRPLRQLWRRLLSLCA